MKQVPSLGDEVHPLMSLRAEGEAISSFLARRLRSFDFAPHLLRSRTTPHKLRGTSQDRRRPGGLLTMTNTRRILYAKNEILRRGVHPEPVEGLLRMTIRGNPSSRTKRSNQIASDSEIDTTLRSSQRDGKGALLRISFRESREAATE